MRKFSILVDIADAETGESIARNVTLDSCFPDDREAATIALDDIDRHGKHIAGGGAAPMFKITVARP